MKKAIFNFKIIAIAITTIITTSCSDDNDGTEPITATDYSAVIENLADNVYTATYKSLEEQASVLKTKLDALLANPNTTTLNEARDAWRSTRQPWENSEAFLFGPAGETGSGALSLDGKLDSWPVAVNDLEAFLEGSTEITASLVANHDDTWKGFHGIEYLLWGSSSVKTSGDFTTRELEYLTLISAELKENTAALYTGWANGFATIFKAAGTSNGNEWTSQKSALQAATSVGITGDLSGMYNIANEVSTGKIAAAYGNSEEEESRFSHNSKTDFMNNMRSIQNVYLGTYGPASNGLGIGNIISVEDQTLHTRFITELSTAINAIDAINGTFTEAITNDQAGIQNAIDKVAIVAETLNNDIAPIINNLITE